MLKAKMVSNFVIGTVLGASLLAFATQKYLWPFIPYDMYSQMEPDLFALAHFEGKTASGETVLLRHPRFFHPFNEYEIWQASQNHFDRKLRTGDQLTAGLLKVYERNRREGLHNGPELIELHFQLGVWKLERSLAEDRGPDSTISIGSAPTH